MSGKTSQKPSEAASDPQDLLILPQQIVLASTLLSRALISLTDVKGDKGNIEKLVIITQKIQILSKSLHGDLIKLKADSDQLKLFKGT